MLKALNALIHLLTQVVLTSPRREKQTQAEVCATQKRLRVAAKPYQCLPKLKRSFFRHAGGVVAGNFDRGIAG